MPKLFRPLLTPHRLPHVRSHSLPSLAWERMTRILPPSSAGSSPFFSPPQSPGLMALLLSPSPMCQVCLSPGSSVPRDEGHRAVLGQKKQAGTDAKGQRGGHIGLFIHCFPCSGLRVLHGGPSHGLGPGSHSSPTPLAHI